MTRFWPGIELSTFPTPSGCATCYATDADSYLIQSLSMTTSTFVCVVTDVLYHYNYFIIKLIIDYIIGETV